jgi:hypothetical protein
MEEKMREMSEEIRLLRENGQTKETKQTKYPGWEVYRVSACGNKTLYKCLEC